MVLWLLGVALAMIGDTRGCTAIVLLSVGALVAHAAAGTAAP